MFVDTCLYDPQPIVLLHLSYHDKTDIEALSCTFIPLRLLPTSYKIMQVCQNVLLFYVLKGML